MRLTVFAAHTSDLWTKKIMCAIVEYKKTVSITGGINAGGNRA